MSMELGKIKLSITLDPAIVQKLPKKNRSYAIEEILRTHYQMQGANNLYEHVKQKLLRDKDMNDWIVVTVQETMRG